MNKFTTPEKLSGLIEIRKENSACKIEVPRPSETITFQNFIKINESSICNRRRLRGNYRKNRFSHTKSRNIVYRKISKAYSIRFFYYVKKEGEENYAEPFVYRGEDCVDKFCEMIEEEVKEIAEIYKNMIPRKMTAENNDKFQSAVDCHICSKKLNNNTTILFKKDPIHKSCLPKESKDASEFS